MTIIAPVDQKQRAVVIDALRGFALVGVLIANFTSFTDQQVPPDILAAISSPFDTFLSRINTVFIEWKFMTLFSILFGYGFGLLMTSVEKKNINPDLFFIRRMGWLFMIGFIHASFWWYDVLHYYAVSGLLLSLFRRSGQRTILICSAVFMFIVPFCWWLTFHNRPETFTDEDFRKAYENFKYGDLITLFKTNWIGNYEQFIRSGQDIPDIIETLGRFLFGYYLLRIHLFESIETKVSLFRRILYITLPVAITYFVVRWLASIDALSIDSAYGKLFMKVGIFSTTCFYSSLVVLSFISKSERRVFKALQGLGKMTLTNYLLVSVAMITLLYGIGFGMLGELAVSVIWLLAVIWLSVEIIFSAWWLGEFRYGPVEWLWRSLTYGKWLTLRK